MPTTYTNGLKLPDLGSIDWYNSYKNNIDILDPIVGTVNGVATTYAPISHNHSASEITSGTIDIARLPPAALERMHIVADQTARYALTTSTVQEGDTVKQTDTGVMYLVVDSTKLNSADGYTEYSAGTASKAIADEDGTNIKSGYVNIAGNQTVTGSKDWSNLQTFSYSQIRIKSLSQEIGVTPSTSVIQYLEFADNNNVQHGKVGLWDYDNGASEIQLSISDKYKNGVKDATGTSDTAFLSFGFQYNGTKFLTFSGQVNNSIIPLVTNAYALGSSSYQWRSIHVQNYYYNGTQWGLDQANAWTNVQTYSAYKYGQMILLKNTGLDFSVNGNTGLTDAYQQMIHWVDKNNTIYSSIQSWTASSENTLVLRSYYRTDANTSRNLSVRFTSTATNKVIYPETNADTELGTSTNKWKSFNGVNPGALGMPTCGYTDSIALDTTDWDYAGNGFVLSMTDNNGNYIPGWIVIVAEDVGDAFDFIKIRLTAYTRSPGLDFATFYSGSQYNI